MTEPCEVEKKISCMKWGMYGNSPVDSRESSKQVDIMCFLLRAEIGKHTQQNQNPDIVSAPVYVN